MVAYRYRLYRFYRPLVAVLLPVVLIACMSSEPIVAENATVPLGIDLGGSGPVAAPERQHAAPALNSAEMQMAHEGHSDIRGSGTVNSVDPAQQKVNVSHNPIPEIGWAAMTMDFPVAPSVDLRALKPGTRVDFTIEKSQGGMYEIQTISPAGGGR